jgi:hypothetical protein
MFREVTTVGYRVYRIVDGDATLRDIYNDLFADGFRGDHLFPAGDQIPEGLAKISGTDDLPPRMSA